MTKTTSVYAIAQLKILNPKAFYNDYAEPIKAIHEKYGVEVLSASEHAIVVEGSYSHNFTVIMKFPSIESQKEWYRDENYQSLKARRFEITDPNSSHLIVVPSLGVNLP